MNRFQSFVCRFVSVAPVIAVTALGILAAGSVNGATLSFSFTDAVGDSTAVSGDLTGMSFVFDNATGDYTIMLSADAANPFLGELRINVNLLNPDTGTNDPNPAFFQDTGNDFDFTTSTTAIVLTGTNTRLTSWSAGDRVAANDMPFGNPSGGTQSFNTGLVDLPLGGAACTIGQDCLGPFDASNFVTIVPEPASAVLVAGGLVGLALARRGRNRIARTEAI